MSLFNLNENGYNLNYTQRVGAKLRNKRPAALDIYSHCLQLCIGDRLEFTAWLKPNLEHFFADFLKKISPENIQANEILKRLHPYIQKNSNSITFKNALAFHIFIKLEEIDLTKPFGWDTVYTIIIHYIADLYGIQLNTQA